MYAAAGRANAEGNSRSPRLTPRRQRAPGKRRSSPGSATRSMSSPRSTARWRKLWTSSSSAAFPSSSWPRFVGSPNAPSSGSGKRPASTSTEASAPNRRSETGAGWWRSASLCWELRSARVTLAPRAKSEAPRLQRLKESNQIRLLALCQMDVEPTVIEVHHFGQICGEAIVEIGSSSRQPTEDRSLEFGDVPPSPGDQRAARIARSDQLASGAISQRIQRKVWRPPTLVSQTNVDRQRHRAIAAVGSVVAGGASAHQILDLEIVVQALYFADVNRSGVE